MIIKSRGETIEEENLAVTAVLQANHVNTTLFYIQVSVSSGPVTEATDHTTTAALPVLKHVNLKADVNDKDLSIELGKSLQVGFKVKNFASMETFTFVVKVLVTVSENTISYSFSSPGLGSSRYQNNGA